MFCSCNRENKCNWINLPSWAGESLVRLNSTSCLSGEWRVTVLFFLQTELENEHCFEVVHRRQMFIIVSLFQRIILCWPAGKIICSSRKEPIIHKSFDWRPVFCILDDDENRKHNENELKQTKDIKILTDKLNARREHESGTLLENEWSKLVRDETLLEHLGFFANVSMHEMNQMFWIHGSESFLWTILFRVTVQRFTIYHPRTLLRASILNSGYYVWFTCRQMENIRRLE